MDPGPVPSELCVSSTISCHLPINNYYKCYKKSTHTKFMMLIVYVFTVSVAILYVLHFILLLILRYCHYIGHVNNYYTFDSVHVPGSSQLTAP